VVRIAPSECDDLVVLTTIDLPDDLHEVVHRLAREGDRSIDDVIATLIRRGLRRDALEPAAARRGLPQISVRRAVSAEDVRSSDDA
jgi:predicted transcriptional regulator